MTDKGFLQRAGGWRPLIAAICMILILAGCSDQSPQLELSLTDPQLEWVGQQIFRNECAGEVSCLVHWNEGEAFPSLGIGHFIWYPKGVDGRFLESFPLLVEFMAQRSAPLPEWLAGMQPLDAPWPDRDAFLARRNDDQVESLRRFLADTRGLQAEFIVRRAQASLERVVEAAPQAERPVIRERVAALGTTPGGTYALIDYVNFKGEGLSPREAYRGEGWGLLQVLRQMNSDEGTGALQQFREAAAAVLTRRANNASDPIEKQRWLAGWLKRLDTYREPG